MQGLINEQWDSLKLGKQQTSCANIYEPNIELWICYKLLLVMCLRPDKKYVIYHTV